MRLNYFGANKTAKMAKLQGGIDKRKTDKASIEKVLNNLYACL